MAGLTDVAVALDFDLAAEVALVAVEIEQQERAAAAVGGAEAKVETVRW